MNTEPQEKMHLKDILSIDLNDQTIDQIIKNKIQKSSSVIPCK
jgi:hypothetical protein